MTEHYVGEELEVFARATNWKRYWTSKVQPAVAGDVLEVGAGVGANTKVVRPGSAATSWTCLEPDPSLAAQMKTAFAIDPDVRECEVRCDTIATLDPQRRFDSILYFDVLEHIADDHGELERAVSRLRPRGTLVVLAPAHQWLYSDFDRSIGHERRYTKPTLEAAAPAVLRIESMIYLDSVGMFASLANRILLRQPYPNLRQILLWDRVMIPLSRLVDPVTFHRLGKSVLAIWRLP